MKTKMKTALLVSGYSRAGKSTTLNHISGSYPDVKVVSTSALLSTMASSFITSQRCEQAIAKQVVDTKDDYTCKSLSGLTVRELKIAIAEQVIVPFFGRFEGLVLPALRAAVEDGVEKVIFETIGGEEATLAADYLRKNGYTLKQANMTCPTEEPDGTRSLLSDAISVWFDKEHWFEAGDRTPAERLVAYLKS
jgi:hypothetical protein